MLEMPFSIVKLDKSIVQSAHRDRAASDFLRLVVKIAQSRSMKVIAEGVEDGATWARMRDYGVHAAQGFLVSRPLTPPRSRNGCKAGAGRRVASGRHEAARDGRGACVVHPRRRVCLVCAEDSGRSAKDHADRSPLRRRECFECGAGEIGNVTGSRSDLIRAA